MPVFWPLILLSLHPGPPSVKKYIARLSAEERQQLEARIRKGKGPARRLQKARILLKADVSDFLPSDDRLPRQKRRRKRSKPGTDVAVVRSPAFGCSDRASPAVAR